MKKEIIIVIVIVTLIIIGHIFTQNYINEFFNDICYKLDEIEENINNNGESSILDSKISNIQEKWNNKFNIIAIFVEHDELEKVETHLITIKADIDTKEYNKCIEEIEKCKFVLKHISDKDALKIVNIF